MKIKLLVIGLLMSFGGLFCATDLSNQFVEDFPTLSGAFTAENISKAREKAIDFLDIGGKKTLDSIGSTAHNLGTTWENIKPHPRINSFGEMATDQLESARQAGSDAMNYLQSRGQTALNGLVEGLEKSHLGNQVLDSAQRLGLIEKPPVNTPEAVFSPPTTLPSMPTTLAGEGALAEAAMQEYLQNSPISQSPTPTISIDPYSSLWKSAQPYVLAPGRYLQENVNIEFLRNLANQIGWQNLSPEAQQAILSSGAYGTAALSLGALYAYRKQIADKLKRAKNWALGSR